MDKYKDLIADLRNITPADFLEAGEVLATIADAADAIEELTKKEKCEHCKWLTGKIRSVGIECECLAKYAGDNYYIEPVMEGNDEDDR